MKDIKFTLAARCEAAGRDSNEDNYQIVADIATDRHGFTANEELTLGSLGTLLVVCDGMGGMNAGEVASAIAVKTVKDAFATENITQEVLSQPEEFIVKAIQAADAAIKEHEKSDPETEGMGSTIVLVWLLNGKAYVGWCGDSRAYRYNAVSGLERLSHDHSYVQELVDAGSITEELAFFHPNNNIITRSLGDPRGAALPDTKVFDIQQGDLFLLCSDGLCGCLQDNQIQEVIEQHHATVSECRDALWAADEAAGWHDNVTTILAQITAGGVAPAKRIVETAANKEVSASKAKLLRDNRRLKLIVVAALAVVAVLAVIFLVPTNGNDGNNTPMASANPDSTAIQTETESEEQPSDTIALPKPAQEPSKEPIEPDKNASEKAKSDKAQPKAAPKSDTPLDKLNPNSARNAREEKQVEDGVKLSTGDTNLTPPPPPEKEETVPEVVIEKKVEHKDDTTHRVKIAPQGE